MFPQVTAHLAKSGSPTTQWISCLPSPRAIGGPNVAPCEPPNQGYRQAVAGTDGQLTPQVEFSMSVGPRSALLCCTNLWSLV